MASRLQKYKRVSPHGTFVHNYLQIKSTGYDGPQSTTKEMACKTMIAALLFYGFMVYAKLRICGKAYYYLICCWAFNVVFNGTCESARSQLFRPAWFSGGGLGNRPVEKTQIIPRSMEVAGSGTPQLPRSTHACIYDEYYRGARLFTCNQSYEDPAARSY